MLAAEKCVYNLLCSGAVRVGLKDVVKVDCVHSARQFVDVCVDDFAVVHRDWRVGDDVVLHWFGFKGLKMRVEQPRPCWLVRIMMQSHSWCECPQPCSATPNCLQVIHIVCW